MVDEIECAEARSLRTQDAAAPLHALAREGGTVELAGQFLVVAEEVAYLAGTDSNVAGRHVHIRSDDLIEFAHKGLTELHHLVVALAANREIAAALAAAHGQRGQCVLKRLLEAQELQYGEVHRRVESQSTLVRANGTIELHAVADVHLNLALVVDPGHAEGSDTFGLDDTLNNLSLLEFRMLVVHIFYRLQHFTYSLQVL